MYSSWIKSLLLMTPLSAVLALSSCGSSPTPVSPTTPVAPSTPVSPSSPSSFAESWHFSVSNSSLTLDAALTLSANSIVGMGHVQSYTASSACPSFFDGLPLSGTIDAQGHVSIKSSPVKGEVLSLDGDLAPDRSSLSNGNYQLTGGCEAERTGTLTGAKFNPLNGLYTGTLQLSGNTIDVSAQLTQAAQSGSDGLFGLSGTVTLQNSCDQTYTLDGASVVGSVVHLYSNTGTELDGLTGVMDSEAQQIELNDYIYSDDCIAGSQGMITRQ